MLQALKFVQGAVAKKDFVQALTHFRIEGGMVKGYNGALGLGCPIDMDLNITPNAVQFVKAISACTETIQMHVTPTGRLAIRSGKFRAYVDCLQDEFPTFMPEGQRVDLAGGIVEHLKTLFPFISEDASRPWSRGILFRGHSAYATNNIVAVEKWLGYTFPVEVNLPRAAIVELIRIKEDPQYALITDNSISFIYPDGRWLRTQTLSAQWPDLSRVLDVPSTPLPLDEELFSALEAISPFCNDLGMIWFWGAGVVSTASVDGEGAAVDVSCVKSDGIFNVKQFLSLKGLASTIDLSTYPKPCAFFGHHTRGVIVGMRPL